MISITNLKRETDLNIIAGYYADYYSNSVLQEKWTKESVIKLFKYFLFQNKELFLVAYDDKKPVGVIMSVLKPWWDGNHLEDGEIFVIQEYRRQGIAKLLLRTLLELAIDKYDITTFEAHTYEDESGFPYCWYKSIGFKSLDDLKIISGDVKEIIKNI